MSAAGSGGWRAAPLSVRKRKPPLRGGIRQTVKYAKARPFSWSRLFAIKDSRFRSASDSVPCSERRNVKFTYGIAPYVRLASV